MGLPQLNSCCFFFDLKTGTIICGVINSILSFIMLVALIVTAAIFGSLQSNEEIKNDPDAEAYMTGLYVISIILVLMYLVKFLSDLVFVYGVLRENAGVIKAYLIVWLVFFLLSTFLFFLHIADFHAATIVTEIIYTGLNLYALLLANSFYKQLNCREEL
ncbi:uncharacterized protein LOC135077863 [Ostrinia nubilalis]|uniref:uncharacterized protein LOC135077863 n=1 Tax=Ostrinia nubilalis TaxID=29057 RepID=UPI0030825A61